MRIPQSMNSYMAKLEKHLQLVLGKKLKKIVPITTLYFFNGLQIVEHQLDCSDQLEELHACTKVCLNEKVSKKTGRIS